MSTVSLKPGTPVYNTRGLLKYGVIKEKTMVKNGWQFYSVNWAHLPNDNRHYRADELKSLNVPRKKYPLTLVVLIHLKMPPWILVLKLIS
jgi:hypothetical protein